MKKNNEVVRMPANKSHAKWWQLYITLPILVGLFAIEMRLPLTNVENIAAQLGILLLIYGFIHLWLRANRRALSGLDEEQGEWRMRVYEIPPNPQASLPERNSDRPLFQFPEAGLKGVLSDTFELVDSEKGSAALPETIHPKERIMK